MIIRIGHGFDVHRFGEGDSLSLGGVEIPYEHGFIAHSDGDVLLHAVIDALLGAIGKGDIGKRFPDQDPQYKGISSRLLVQNVWDELTAEGWQINNLDVTIIAQAPKMAPYIEAMRESLSDMLNAQLPLINVKATTTEGLGYAGRKEGIAVHAVCLLVKPSIN